MRSTTGRGFSLIELMIVCAIIAVLAAIAQTAYDAYISETSKDATVAAPLDCPPGARNAAAGTAPAATPRASVGQAADPRCDSATRRIQNGVAPMEFEVPATGGRSARLERTPPRLAPGAAATSG